jgi:hypothetical protein
MALPNPTHTARTGGGAAGPDRVIVTTPLTNTVRTTSTTQRDVTVRPRALSTRSPRSQPGAGEPAGQGSSRGAGSPPGFGARPLSPEGHFSAAARHPRGLSRSEKPGRAESRGCCNSRATDRSCVRHRQSGELLEGSASSRRDCVRLWNGRRKKPPCEPPGRRRVCRSKSASTSACRRSRRLPGSREAPIVERPAGAIGRR